MPEVSVIICTHNPRRDYLARTVMALRSQTAPASCWELIIVDNASAEPVADMCDLSWHPMGRHVAEPKPGLAHARLRGIAESSSDLLLFVDDDNVLASDYLVGALRIARDCKFLGIWGSGSIDLEFEVEPSPHLKYLFPWLGLRRIENPVWSNSISCREATPIGAGLCLRRCVASMYLDFYRNSTVKIVGRTGTSLGGHEDYEICYLACKAGLGMGNFPELKLLHLIAKERVTDAHILKLVEGLTLSQAILGHKWGGELPRSPFSPRGAVSVAMSTLTRRGFDRRVYFAELRAVIAARRMLAATVTPQET